MPGAKGRQLALDNQPVLAAESFRRAVEVAPNTAAARMAQAELTNLRHPPGFSP